MFANIGDPDSNRLDLKHLLPQGVVSTTRVNHWTLAYRAFRNGNPLPDNGVIKVWHHGTDVEGYAQVDLWLPAAQHATASRVLNSLRLS